MSDYHLHEMIGISSQECEFHVKHTVKTLRRLDVDVIERKQVRQVWAEGYAGHALPTVEVR